MEYVRHLRGVAGPAFVGPTIAFFRRHSACACATAGVSGHRQVFYRLHVLGYVPDRPVNSVQLVHFWLMMDLLLAGSDGHMHTGPTASPENSYILRQDKNEKFSSRYVRVVTHSPNIDMAVLRQISNIYSLALSWAEMEKDGSTVLREYLETPEYKTDMGLSVSFREIIEKMPNGAVPKISERKEVDTSAVPGTNKVLPHETSKKTLSKFVIDEYSSAPLTTSERRGIKNYMYASRPNSDRQAHIL